MAPTLTISPTSASGLTGTSWTLVLPAPEQWSLVAPRVFESATTISGTMIHSAWVADVTAAKPRYKQIITEADFQKLLTIYNHATVYTWMLGADGRCFEVSLSNITEQRVYRGGRQMRDVTIEFLIVRELAL